VRRREELRRIGRRRVDCNITPTSSRQFWGIGPFFPTSELSLLPQGDKLALHWFNGLTV